MLARFAPNISASGASRHSSFVPHGPLLSRTASFHTITEPLISKLVPVLKSEGLYTTDPSNYLPIVNVTFLCKIIEKASASWLIAYLEENNLLPLCQSGFQKIHSTETLLLCLLSNINVAVYRSQFSLLALFEVSAAFDSVDHGILLKRPSISIWPIW